MTIVVPCPHCKTKFNLQPELVGKVMRCPNLECRKEFTVREQPRPVEPPPTPPAEPEVSSKRMSVQSKVKKVEKPKLPAMPAKPNGVSAGIVEAEIVDAAVIAPPKVKEVVWSEGANLPPQNLPPQKESSQKGSKKAPPARTKKKGNDFILPVRRRKKNKHIMPWILIGMVILIVFFEGARHSGS